tara:strand:- start:578 stop:1423 length:846 start_codon:yes stop_codon:yes gene_type:complete
MTKNDQTSPPEDRITLRQSWLGQLAMCPERARQDLLGISESTESSNTAIGTAVHYGIEQCLLDQMQTGEPMTMRETQEIAVGEWNRKVPEIVRWNHKSTEAIEIIAANTEVWWNEVRPGLRPTAVEHEFNLPLVLDHEPEIWLKGTIDCVQEPGMPIIDWKNPGRKPHDAWEKKRWSVQAAAYTWAIVAEDGADLDSGSRVRKEFEFVHLVKGTVHRTLVDVGPAEWASLVMLARSAGTLITANLPIWPLTMSGWHCSPKWCGAWATCRGALAGPDPWNQL